MPHYAEKKLRRTIILLLGFCIGIFILTILPQPHIQAQNPTPFAPILIQGNANVGKIQPFAMSAVAVRTGIRAWQDLGWTGKDVRVGVLDRGFGGIHQFEQDFNQVVTVALGDDKGAYNASPIIHGSEVLETIYAVAPGAKFYVCQYETMDKFTSCIDWMIASGVHIINHSAGVPALPLDGSSRWSRQVDRAAKANIVWINSAGNFAQGYYTDVLTDNNLNTLHEFRGNAGTVEALGVSPIESSTAGVAMLSWLAYGDRQANEIDIDLQIIDARTGEVIAVSDNPQAGFPDDQALEYLSFDMRRPFAVQIIDRSGNAAGARFALFVEFAQLPSGEVQRSIIAPGDSPNALTVGALQGANLAPYSSRGPLATGAIKPDLTAPGEVQLANGTWFVGTSAAAPVVAGSAALIWEAYPAYTAADVRTFLLNATQDDSDILGNDINYGNGRLYMPVPLFSPEQPTQTPLPPSQTPVPSTPTQRPTQTPVPPTPTKRPTQTSVPPTPTRTPRPATRTPTKTPTTAPTRTPTTTPARVTINVASANLREGPGTTYDLAASAAGGTSFDVLTRTQDSSWYKISRGNGQTAWVWSGLVDLDGTNSQIRIDGTYPVASGSTSGSSTTTQPRATSAPSTSQGNSGKSTLTLVSASPAGGTTFTEGGVYNVAITVNYNLTCADAANVYIRYRIGNDYISAISIGTVSRGSGQYQISTTSPAFNFLSDWRRQEAIDRNLNAGIDVLLIDSSNVKNICATLSIGYPVAY